MGTIIPPETPCSTRMAMQKESVAAAPVPTEARVNTPRQRMKMRRRPK